MPKPLDHPQKKYAGELPILLVDDEGDVLFTSSLILERAGLGLIETLADSRQVMPLLDRLQGQLAVVVLDLHMPHITGKELLEQIRQRYPEIPVIVMTAVQEVENAVSCMKMGAQDYLVKPVEESRFISSIARQVELTQLKNRVSTLKNALLDGQLRQPQAFSHIVFQSPRMLSAMQYLEAIAPSMEPVLVLGETGVGKGMAVAALHQLSNPQAPFVTVNMGGVDDLMFSDTLFGHVKGAFTGADSHRHGMIAKAKGGILFLDEIGDLSPLSQIKLLQLIQDGVYSPLGSDTSYAAGARLVCATNRELGTMVKEGRFRADLYYRLKVHQVRILPLRERPEDMEPLIRHFLGEAAKSQNKPTPTPPAELFTLLATHSFPGNVRELRGMIYDAVARHGKGILSLSVFREAVGGQASVKAEDNPRAATTNKLVIMAGFPTLEEAKEFLIDEALRQAGGNQSIAASLLGISRRALNGRLARNRPIP